MLLCLQVRQSRRLNLLLLGIGNRLGRQTIIQGPPGFNFHESDGGILTGNQVNLALTQPVIAFQDRVAFPFQESRRDFLAPPA